MLEALAQAIELALRAARATPYRTGEGTADHAKVEIEVEVTSDPDDLKYVAMSVDDLLSTVAGWAEAKRCNECQEPVALLFDDAYLETSDGEGIICCECYRRIEDDRK